MSVLLLFIIQKELKSKKITYYIFPNILAFWYINPQYFYFISCRNRLHKQGNKGIEINSILNPALWTSSVLRGILGKCPPIPLARHKIGWDVSMLLSHQRRQGAHSNANGLCYTIREKVVRDCSVLSMITFQFPACSERFSMREVLHSWSFLWVLEGSPLKVK